MSRENTFVESYKALLENNKVLAEKERAKIQEKEDRINQFKNNYYAIRENRVARERAHGELLEAARNDAFAKVLKAIYITALEADTLTDTGIVTAEVLVENWIAENGGAHAILTKNKYKSNFLKRINDIVEAAALRETEEVEDIPEDIESDGTEAAPEEDDKIERAKKALRDIGFPEDKLQDVETVLNLVNKHDDNAEPAEGEEAPAAEEDTDTTEDEVEVDEVEDDEETTETSGEDEKSASEPTEEPEDSTEDSEEKSDEEEVEDLDDEMGEDEEESDDNEEESEEEESEEEDEESEESEDMDDVLGDNDDEESGDEDEEIELDSDSDEDDDVDDVEIDDIDLDGDGQSDSVEIDQLFKDLEDEEDVHTVIDTIRDRIADAEEKFIKKNAEDKEKVDELLKKINNSVKTIEDIDDKDHPKSKIEQEHVQMYRRQINDITENCYMSVFDKMVREVDKAIYKNQSVREAYFTEDNGQVDTEMVVERAKVLYGFLETLNTLKLVNVDNEYIKTVLNNIAE